MADTDIGSCTEISGHIQFYEACLMHTQAPERGCHVCFSVRAQPARRRPEIWSRIGLCVCLHFRTDVHLQSSSKNTPHARCLLLEDRLYFHELFLSLALDPVIW